MATFVNSCIISIHAPRAGCDCQSAQCHLHGQNFNPRTPCGVRLPFFIPRQGGENFNPRTPCGVRQRGRYPGGGQQVFQSTHPVRGATAPEPDRLQSGGISIHAPRAGCDGEDHRTDGDHRHFNPRTPCGVRQRARDPCPGRGDFNPRTPCGVRPLACCVFLEDPAFQSTHPVRGATSLWLGRRRQSKHFNPRTPCGVRPSRRVSLSQPSRFQSTHPVRGATVHCLSCAKLHTFQSTHPVRGATREVLVMADTEA